MVVVWRGEGEAEKLVKIYLRRRETEATRTILHHDWSNR